MRAKSAYQYFWAVAIICGFLACINYVSGDNKRLDINIYDTYYVIANTHLYTALCLLYFTIGLIYRISRRQKLNKKLTAAHTIITAGGFIVYYVLWVITSAMHNPYDLFDNSMELLNTGSVLIALLITLAQLLLPVNILIAFAKRNPKTAL